MLESVPQIGRLRSVGGQMPERATLWWLDGTIRLLEDLKTGRDDLTVSQLLYLLHVARNDGELGPKALATRLGFSPSGSSNVLKVLSHEGRDDKGTGWNVIERIPDPVDGRAQRLRLTWKGRDVVKGIGERLAAIARRYSGGSPETIGGYQ